MDYQEIIVLLVVVLLSALAVYFVISTETPAAEELADTTEATELLMKGVAFGEGYNNYVYSYEELSDGYKTEYTLTKNGDSSIVEVRNPLSNKKAYFMSNDTVLCIEYPPGSEVCSSVKNNARVSNYMESLRVKMFNETRISNGVTDTGYLIAKGYLKLDADIVNKSNCREISYTLDYTNASVGDAARFGIQINSPKVFEVTMCVNNKTGYMAERTFSYMHEGIEHVKSTKMVSFSSTSSTVTAPENLSDGAVDALEKEREQQVKLVDCYTSMSGDDRDQCIAGLALTLKRKDMCEFAGTRRDRCLISLMPILKDEEICPTVQDAAFRDDCYIELAGAYSDSSYCDSVTDSDKKEYCLEVATPPEPEPEPEESEVGNETENEIDMSSFMEYLDDYEPPAANGTE